MADKREPIFVRRLKGEIKKMNEMLKFTSDPNERCGFTFDFDPVSKTFTIYLPLLGVSFQVEITDRYPFEEPYVTFMGDVSFLKTDGNVCILKSEKYMTTCFVCVTTKKLSFQWNIGKWTTDYNILFVVDVIIDMLNSNK